MVSDHLTESLYIGHGAPTVAIDPQLQPYKNDLHALGKDLDTPKAIVVVSAHWQEYLPIQITSAEKPGIIYDYYGFPQEMYDLTYDFVGNPSLAKTVSQELAKSGVNSILNVTQGIDHGAWIPLREIYPAATVPIIQISIPVPRTADYLFKLGQMLSPLRNEGIMFMGSGNLTHNLRHVMMQAQKYGGIFGTMPNEQWALEADKWLKDNLENHSISSLLESASKMPNFELAAPTTEHFDPLYFVLGTLNDKEGLNNFHESFQGGSISMRSFHSQI